MISIPPFSIGLSLSSWLSRVHRKKVLRVSLFSAYICSRRRRRIVSCIVILYSCGLFHHIVFCLGLSLSVKGQPTERVAWPSSVYQHVDVTKSMKGRSYMMRSPGSYKLTIKVERHVGRRKKWSHQRGLVCIIQRTTLVRIWRSYPFLFLDGRPLVELSKWTPPFLFRDIYLFLIGERERVLLLHFAPSLPDETK